MQQIDELMIFGKALADRGLVWGHSGNISARVDTDIFLITAGGADLSMLMDDDIIPCRIVDDSYEGLRAPSMEIGLHRGIYRTNADAMAVIHSQPFYAATIACSDIEVRSDLLPEAMVYLGQVARVPYYHAGSMELAEAVAARASDSRVLLLANHGVVCWANSLREAFLKTETLEFLCRIIVTARGGGMDMNYLGDEAVQDFADYLKRTGRLP
ncbi:class II aldolase/adducin family protein [Chloroflexota bacterium]